MFLQTVSKCPTVVGSCRIQEKNWQTKDKLERYSEQGIQRLGLTWEEVEASAQDRQTWRQRVAPCIGDAG